MVILDDSAVNYVNESQLCMSLFGSKVFYTIFMINIKTRKVWSKGIPKTKRSNLEAKMWKKGVVNSKQLSENV